MPLRTVLGQLGPFGITQCHFEPFWRFKAIWAILVLFWPFWGPREYRNGPRVVQHDIHSCNIPMGSVLGSFGAFQGNIWSVAPFIPVRRGQKRVKKHEKRVFSKSPKLMIFLKPVPNYPHFPPKYG